LFYKILLSYFRSSHFSVVHLCMFWCCLFLCKYRARLIVTVFLYDKNYVPLPRRCGSRTHVSAPLISKSAIVDSDEHLHPLSNLIFLDFTETMFKMFLQVNSTCISCLLQSQPKVAV
jgi:hypothetical protein